MPNFSEEDVFVMVGAGDEYTVALTSTGKLYGWGLFPQDNVPELREGEIFIMVAAGYNYIAALTSMGKIHIWGMDDLELDPCDQPKLADGEVVAMVSASSQHLAALTTLGKIHCCGFRNLGVLLRAVQGLSPKLLPHHRERGGNGR